jgi:hypothetical protein
MQFVFYVYCGNAAKCSQVKGKKQERKKMRSTLDSIRTKSYTGKIEDRNDTTLKVSVILFLMLGLVGANAFSATIRLAPNPSDLNDLDHDNYYTWGIVQPIPTGEKISSATLTFKDIRNWDNEPNKLYVHLLDKASTGVYVGSDTRTGDYFAGKGISLVTYTNIPSTAKTLTYSFNLDQLATLNSYIQDTRFGLGFDPDCHFYNNGVSLTLETTPSVPEPATLAMMVLSAATLVLGRRRFIK